MLNNVRKYILILIVGWIVLLLPTDSPGADNCLECHADWEEGERAPSALIKKDVHARAGLSCADCHGGNPELEDMDDVRDSRDYLGIPKTNEIPAFCSRCHSDPSYMIQYNPSLPTDQFDKYKTSIHGQRLLKHGDNKVATCVSCHSVHDIESPSIPSSTVYALNVPGTCAKCHSDLEHMAGYDIPTDQYDEYAVSVHGTALLKNKDIGAPACNDCHGNHGATPPGVHSISAVCGTCHALIADQFASSPHKEAFDERNYPECESCHSNHLVVQPDIAWVGTSETALCSRCHKADDGTTGFETADSIHKTLDSLTRAYQGASDITDLADEKGMMITDQRFALKEIRQALIKSKTVMHSFNADYVSENALPGFELAKKVVEASQEKIDDYYFRRKGLGVASLIITILAIALYRKTKSIEK